VNCPSCGHGNPEQAKFCLECGSALPLRCSQCATELPAEAKFCLECGTAVAQGAKGSIGAAKADRSPADYTPKHLADKILQNRSALEGERKQVTVLFADVKGSMELAGRLDPEVWHGILDGFFSILADGVHRFEGTVNQYTGDGIMALFGAPISHEDHAQRAGFAALHLLDSLRRHSLEVRREHGFDITFRLGLNSGEVVVGRIGDDLRMDYTAAGHCVGMAQRMESLAEAGSCYLSDATAALVEGYFELEDLGEFSVKGADRCVRVHKLLGMGSARTRFDVSRQRGLSRFVGRDEDIRTLESALDRARAGQGSALGVFAEAGTGKSRLCFEFVEQCRASGHPVVEGHAISHGKTLPLVPVYEVFRGYFGVDDSDDPRVAREKIAGRLLLLDESFRDLLPTLFDFLGVGDPAEPPVQMEPEERQRQLFSVTRGLLELSTAEHPGILLIEDLHWLDGASEAWVREWVDAVAGTHNVLLLNSRPEYRAEWMNRSNYQQLALSPLGADAIRELLEGLIGNHATTAGLAEAIYQRTQGNPFFAEEVVRTMIESGELVGGAGAYRLERALEDLRVPDSVQSLLAARIDRLPENAKCLLQKASVIGKEFREPVLAEIAGLDESELRRTLAELRDGEFIYEQSLYPVAEYCFKHPLTQEVALGSQLQDTRRRTHADVAKAIEKFDADRLDEQAAALALHWKESGDKDRAAWWCARAARRAMRTDTEEAYRHWDFVRELSLDSDDDDGRALLGQAYVELVNLGWRSGRPPEESQALFEAGRLLLEESGDRNALALLYSNYSLIPDVHNEKAVTYYYKAVELAQELGDIPLEIAIGAAVFPVAYSGRVREGLALSDHYIELIEANPDAATALLHFNPHSWIYGARGTLRTLLGDTPGAIADVERGLELARDKSAFDRFLAESAAGGVDRWLGDFDAALNHARRGFDLGEQIGGNSTRYMALGNLGTALADVGEWEKALPLFEEAHELRSVIQAFMMTDGFGPTLVHCGHSERALEIAHLYVDRCARVGARLAELLMTFDLAKVNLECGLESEARATAAKFRELAVTCEVVTALPEIAEVEAAIEGKFGTAADRERLLREALAGFETYGATLRASRLRAAIAEEFGGSDDN